MKSSIQTISPSRAHEFLAMNRENRPWRKSQVSYLKEQILSDNWQVTHQGIAISKSGRLLDGQHRLMAIIESKKSVQMMVTTDLPDEAYKVIDCGLKRTHADRIHLLDNPTHNSQLCQILGNYIRCGLRNTGASIPVSMIEDEFLRYADSWLWLIGEFCPPPKIYGRAGILAAIGIYHVVNKERAHEFATAFRTGENLSAGDPVLTLRRHLERGVLMKGNKSDTDYWKAVSAARAHLNRKTIASIFEATEDMLGNKNSCRLITKRTEEKLKGSKNRTKIPA